MSKDVKMINGPIRAILAKDKTYFYCTCGNSSTEPFCDRSEGSECKPLQYDSKEHRVKVLCGCKLTKKPPFCDGSHRKASDIC